MYCVYINIHLHTSTYRYIYTNAYMCTKYVSIPTLMHTCTDTHKHFSDIYCLVRLCSSLQRVPGEPLTWSEEPLSFHRVCLLFTAPLIAKSQLAGCFDVLNVAILSLRTAIAY